MNTDRTPKETYFAGKTGRSWKTVVVISKLFHSHLTSILSTLQA